ncbi:MAG TPA: tyramine oxidase, partial [Ktedonobacter sp.]|nr:tyramine oxidase [Ktedonobacter sp.]
MTSHAHYETNTLQQVTQHPLDPLTEEEVNQTTQILNASGRITPRMRIMAYSLHEPSKEDVLAYQPGQPVQREVFVVIRDHERQLTIESLVSLSDATIRSWHERGDVQPALTYPEVFSAMQATFDDAGFQAVLAKRGITDLASVVL